MKNLLMKMIIFPVIMLSSAIGMDRPIAIAMARTLADNCLVRTCSRCCSYGCCSMATWIGLGEIWACTCAIKPDLSDRCGSDQGTRIALAGAGAIGLGFIAATNYIVNKISEEKLRRL